MSSQRDRSTSAPTWTATDLLHDYYAAVFRRSAEDHLSQKRIETYDSALYRYERYAGGRPTLGSVTEEELSHFAKSAVSRRTFERTARQLAGCVRKVVRSWSGTALPRIAPLPPPPPGSLREYAERVYIPEVMFQATAGSIGKLRRALRRLRRYAGDSDLPIAEVTDAVLAAFYRSLLDEGKPATTINSGYRAPLHCALRHAADHDLIVRPPRIKKLKETREVPDAWTVDEAKRLVDAAGKFRIGARYDDVPCNLWWKAILLIGWSTALRRAPLLAIRHRDLNLEAGMLHVPAERMKNRCAQTFALLPEAVAAAAKIWLPEERELFFPHRSVWGIDKHFRKLLKAADLSRGERRGLSQFHKLRRSTATAIASRAGIAAASALLGHSDTYVTKRYVANVGVANVQRILPSLGLDSRPTA